MQGVPAQPTFGGASGGSSEPAAALVEFNKKFRAVVEEKDAKERDAKNARKTAGKAALKKLLSERTAKVEARKAQNKEEEEAKEREMLDALQGESWGRVVSLIDIHAGASASASSEKSVGSGAGASVSGGSHSEKRHKDHGDKHGDTSRMKDVLVQLKNKPLS
jgi:hypothetical protein